MATIVQKFGGTSVGDVDRIKHAARRVRDSVHQGHHVCVVVSARGGVTNGLVSRALSLSPEPAPREMDVLLSTGEQETIALTAIALESLGVSAVSFTGRQAGILTHGPHTRARIQSIDPIAVRKALRAGQVAVVAGFQGANAQGEITTFGRGGSDLTAISMAKALEAERCQIFTDVEGVFTADPRIVPDARLIPAISYEELLELAGSGSKVMQTRAVEFAQKHGVVFEVASSFTETPGTLVKEEVAAMESVVVSGVAVDQKQSKIVISNLPDRPGTAARVFQGLGTAGVIVDMIVQNIGRGGVANLTFTVGRDDAYRAEKAVRAVLGEIGAGEMTSLTDLAKVSVVGIGMRSHSGVAATLFEALADAGINIQLISTSEIKISVGIDPGQAAEAARAAHRAFNLGEAG